MTEVLGPHRSLVESCTPREELVSSDRFARFPPLAGVLAGLLLAGGHPEEQHSEQ